MTVKLIGVRVRRKAKEMNVLVIFIVSFEHGEMDNVFPCNVQRYSDVG